MAKLYKYTDGGKEEIHFSPSAQRVFDFMDEHGSITTKQAIDELGETRLSGRIFDLKEKGVEIYTQWKKCQNRHGESCKVKVYSLTPTGGAL